MQRTGVALALTAVSLAAQAGTFGLENGIDGRWSLTTSYGTSIRTRDADPNLIGVGNGGKAANGNADDGNLNFKKGQSFSTIASAIGELELKKDKLGVFLRAKAFSDESLKNRPVIHGSYDNAYVPNTPLSDKAFPALSKFSNIKFLDAYVFGTFRPIANHPITVKLGNEVVQWGEGLFIQGGISQFGRFDAAASRRPGAQLKEVLLPIPQVSVSGSVNDSISLEGFYQLAWRSTGVDGCGTFFSPADPLNCSGAIFNPGTVVMNGITLASFDSRSDQQAYNGTSPGTLLGTQLMLPSLSLINFRASRLSDSQPKSSGQFGLAARYFDSESGREFGFFHAQYHQRIPALGLKRQPSNIPGSLFSTNLYPLSFYLDYSAEDIKVDGLTVTDSIGPYSVFAEISHTKGLPVPYNTNDFVSGVLTGTGPLGALRNQTGRIPGFDRKDKTQVQFGGIRVIPRVLGASSLSLIGEVGFEHYSGIGDPMNSVRYGRPPTFGIAETSATSCAQTGNANPDTCEAVGFVTPNSWGYRVVGQLSYPNVIAGANLSPRVFWSHDVKGYSGDLLLVEDRRILGLGVKIDWRSRYYADISYNRFGRVAKYDQFRDRDYASVVVGVDF
ncbi:DUF1302 domain-containing protein [Limnobacter litoralis]|uniref:DUF1302 domain-containing protein n=1 Tax=Limnobacter litoralis TaxID=481366 RepID=A0ABQ5YLR2_9BURK|nr:DUF1302 domain-containing protein [Limnobacter litoralis]GLR25062.1 hypothetical protein GCM10007875_01490 [Limnobacter litoralis]